MPLEPFQGGGRKTAPKLRTRKGRGASGKKGRGKGRKGKKGRKGRTVHPGVWHEQAGAGSLGNASGSAAGEPLGGVGSTAGVSARPAVELNGLMDAPPGLMGALLEMVGEGALSGAGVWAAWQREQDRVDNRAWRRPGGLARMAGL